ncbi:hypothetical protein Taro_028645 [Colocasia esculenta]|uniref:Uncharacterized protein n=1 Tax=Colocasia esculenta TaxID=4460 RepID=A0A843VQY5_COLES|nr:hypothetical protein [Colocasia esculenta]
MFEFATMGERWPVGSAPSVWPAYFDGICCWQKAGGGGAIRSQLAFLTLLSGLILDFLLRLVFLTLLKGLGFGLAYLCGLLAKDLGFCLDLPSWFVGLGFEIGFGLAYLYGLSAKLKGEDFGYGLAYLYGLLAKDLDLDFELAYLCGLLAKGELVLGLAYLCGLLAKEGIWL